MPYTIRKVPNKSCYRVTKSIGSRDVLSKCPTLKNAKKQVRLLNAIDHGFVPRGRRATMRKRMRRNKTHKK